MILFFIMNREQFEEWKTFVFINGRTTQIYNILIAEDIVVDFHIFIINHSNICRIIPASALLNLIRYPKYFDEVVAKTNTKRIFTNTIVPSDKFTESITQSECLVEKFIHMATTKK